MLCRGELAATLANLHSPLSLNLKAIASPPFASIDCFQYNNNPAISFPHDPETKSHFSIHTQLVSTYNLPLDPTQPDQ